MSLPALRPVDASVVEHEGDQVVCLRDPEGIVDEQVVLSRAAFFVASLLDGVNGVTDIQYLFARATEGRILGEQEIRGVVDYLDQHGFLESPRFAALRDRVLGAFERSDRRASCLAGKSYPEDGPGLGRFLDGLFLREDGPGRLPEAGGKAAMPRMLVVPHIDFERGGGCYAQGYLRLAEGAPPSTVFVVGVAHAGPAVPYILTAKHFETPLGTLETDGEAVAQLAEACAWDPFEHEYVHRSEHSIEFQVLLLRYLFGEATRIVPILAGAFGPPETRENPAEQADVQRFLEACRACLEAGDGAACVIAGADLAHVGRRFGDAFEIDETVAAQVERRDREDLQPLLAGDAKGWYRSVMRDENDRRVCGLQCVYSALRMVDGTISKGELLGYGQAPDPAGGMVSFASVALW